MNESRAMSEMTVGGAALPPRPLRYVGFWARVLASLIDSVAVLFVLVPMALVLQFAGVGIADGDPYAQTIVQLMFAAVILGFWILRNATPGKMIIDAVIVDARTLAPPSWQRYLIRYLGYFISMLPFCLGLLWVAFDARKQGWHDKLAGTVVVRRSDLLARPPL